MHRGARSGARSRAKRWRRRREPGTPFRPASANKGAAEKSGLHSRAEKANRADGERFLDPVAIEPGLGNGEFGGRIARWQRRSAGKCRWFASDGRERKTTKNSAAAAPTMIRVKRNKTSRRKMLVRRSSADGFLFHALVLRFGEETFAGPVLQQIAGAQSFFAGCAVGSHASLPKRRAIWTSITSMATPVTTK